jgi:hypothetical protein
VNDIKPQFTRASSYLILLIGLAILLAGYTLLRYGGLIGEGDTAAFTKAIANIQKSGDLTPNTGLVYQNGYGYQVFIAWLAVFTGLSLGVLQIVGGTMLIVWVVLPAWLAYREFTHSELAASLASLLLLIQPEFLFPLLRGTHEKFTRGLMFICLYLLLRSLRSKATHLTSFLVVCFYLCAFALISLNTFMAISFILSIFLALILVWIVGKRISRIKRVGKTVVTKFIYVATSMLVIAFIVIFYAYPPAQYQLRVLQYVMDRVALLTLQVENIASNPYQVINTGWVSLPIYYLVSLANWFLLGLSLVLWLKQSYYWLIKRSIYLTQHEIMLWAFYASFAFLGFSTILADVSGVLSSNLQLRIFPSFVMIAAPLVSVWITQIKPSKNFLQKLIWTGTSLFFGCLMVLSTLKATNEPLLSNYWSFYSPAERASVDWAEQMLQNRRLWTGQWRRLVDSYTIWSDGNQANIDLVSYFPKPATHDYLISDLIRQYSQRLGSQLPIQIDSFITYDNGTAQVYHRRPVTPFQK